MTTLKTRAWMDAWTEADFAEYSAAWHAAEAISEDTGDRSREWLRLVLDAEQAHRQWARDVLADMQRRGALTRKASRNLGLTITQYKAVYDRRLSTLLLFAGPMKELTA